MPILLMLQQTLIPAALLGWMMLRPLPGRLYVVQAAGVGVALLAIAAAGLWIIPPWWAPWTMGAVWAAAVGWRLVRRPSAGRFDSSPGSRSGGLHRLGTAFSALLLLVGGAGVGLTLSARGAPPADVVDIPNPLGPGSYLVAHGGRRALVNGHMKTLDPTVERFRAWRGQSYAVDLVGIDGLGLHADGIRPEDPSRYVIFGSPVFAPCPGGILATESRRLDQPVPRMDSEDLLGNHVLLECEGVVLVFAHLREGSVAVAPGESVVEGQILGEVGNSGNSSEPHLHLHAQRPGTPESPISGEPLGLRIDGRWLVRNDRVEGRAW